MGEVAVAKLKYVLPSLRSLSKKALSEELDKLCSGNDVLSFYKNLNEALSIRRRNILFVGAPGSGKGTYSRIISPVLGIPVFGSGDYMKKEIKRQSSFGKSAQPYVETGKLVPDEYVLPVITSLLSQPVYKSGCILDGFPRNLSQAEAIEKTIPIDLVVYFHLPRDVLIEKLMGRRVCPHCGRSYNVANILNANYHLPPLLPRIENTCDDCHVRLEQRNDDSRAIIEERLRVYENHTEPLLEYYGSKGKNILLQFNICRGVADVPDILKMILCYSI